MHLIAAAGCPSVVLFSRELRPGAVCATRPSRHVLRRPDLADLDVATVMGAATTMLPAEAGALAAG